MLTSDDHLALNGLPAVAATDGMSNNDKRVLAGQGFAGPVAGSLLYILYLNPNAYWWGPEKPMD